MCIRDSPYIYLSGNSDYEKLQNCIYYWQWTEKIYLFSLHVLATHRKIQKYFDFIRRSDQFSLIPKPHLETCRLLILCLFFIPQKWDPSVWLLQTRPRHKILRQSLIENLGCSISIPFNDNFGKLPLQASWAE